MRYTAWHIRTRAKLCYSVQRLTSKRTGHQNSEDVKRGAGLLRRTYLLRRVGFAMGAVPLGLVMHVQHATLWSIAGVCVGCLAWPVLAHKWARRGSDPVFREHCNILVDAVIGGLIAVMIHFIPVGCLVILLMFAVDAMATGGCRLFFLNLAATAIGLLCGAAVFGFSVDVTKYQWLYVAWLPVLIAYPLFLANVIYRSAITLDERSRQLRQISERDSLTGLLNRSTLSFRLQSTLKCAQGIHRRVAVVFIDLDHFKTINDVLGHHVGDRLLACVAQRLEQCVGGSDTIARYGGDEFVIFEACDVRDAGEALARSALTAITEPMNIMGHELFVTASIGTSVFPDDGSDADTLISAADLAMYSAKNRCRSGHAAFIPAMRVAADTRLDLSTRLRGAFRAGKISLHYQPQVDMRTGRILGVEAIPRWHDAQYGEISPTVFIPVAEACGLISALGEWVLETACKQANAWRTGGLAPLRMSINLSPLQLQRNDYLDTVREVLHRTQLPPSFLELEVTESAFINAPNTATLLLAELRKLGVTITVDDFGSGYSCLSQLRTLPIDRIKIDKMFIAHIGECDDGAMARSLVMIAETLGLSVIVQGVESIAQRDFFLATNCIQAQGRLYCKPVEPDVVEHIVREGMLEG